MKSAQPCKKQDRDGNACWYCHGPPSRVVLAPDTIGPEGIKETKNESPAGVRGRVSESHYDTQAVGESGVGPESKHRHRQFALAGLQDAAPCARGLLAP